MKKIVLLCAAGMSTSMLVQHMRQAAEEAGYDYNINAYSVSEVDDVKKEASVILLGPQIRFSLSKIKAQCPGIPVEAISPVDYGSMNGANVLNYARSLMGE